MHYFDMGSANYFEYDYEEECVNDKCQKQNTIRPTTAYDGACTCTRRALVAISSLVDPVTLLLLLLMWWWLRRRRLPPAMIPIACRMLASLSEANVVIAGDSPARSRPGPARSGRRRAGRRFHCRHLHGQSTSTSSY